MLNGLFAWVLALVVFGGVMAYDWARRRDAADIAEWHLLHGPNDGCPECVDK